jgi:hypothetical protein
MENPGQFPLVILRALHPNNPTVKEIPGVIHLLTQSPPSIQEEAIETYFTPNASFTHPFCRTGSWSNSRWLVGKIYRWYKIMSPRIDMSVQSVGKIYPYPFRREGWEANSRCKQRSTKQI